MKTIVSVIGARPQFIKAAPVELALAAYRDIKHYSVHTGQHYDPNMSQIFFDQLGLQKPYRNLNIGSGSHAEQTAAILAAMEPVLIELKPHLLIVYGDTNSTIAAALCAAKLGIKVAHIEAGLRSYNKSMPEEINRILTDHISDLLFAPTLVAMDILQKEGVANTYLTGDVMLDMIQIAKNRGALTRPVNEEYYYTTLHRPYNTDNEDRLKQILSSLNTLDRKVIFSLHPRTRNLMNDRYGILDNDYPQIKFIAPQGYFENLAYLNYAECLITDSGGMQKEAYFLNKRCITVRSETEWVETLENNCNTLIWNNLEEIKGLLKKPVGPFNNALYGNGNSAEIIVKIIAESLNTWE